MTMTTDSVILAYGKHNVMLKLEKSQVFWARPKKHCFQKKECVEAKRTYTGFYKGYEDYIIRQMSLVSSAKIIFFGDFAL